MLNIRFRRAILFLQRAKFWLCILCRIVFAFLAKLRNCIKPAIKLKLEECNLSIFNIQRFLPCSVMAGMFQLPSSLSSALTHFSLSLFFFLSLSLSLSLSFSFSFSFSFSLLSLLSVNRYHVNGGKKYLEQNKTKHDSDSLNNLQALGEIFLSIIKKLFCLALTPVLELVDT